MIEGDDSILKQFTDKSQSFTEAQSALKKLAAATDRTWPRFSEQAILAESSDAIRYNKRAADLMSAAATQRRARVEMTSFMEKFQSMVGRLRCGWQRRNWKPEWAGISEHFGDAKGVMTCGTPGRRIV